MKLSTCLHQFFGQYLPRIKGVSVQTLKTYRDTFTLFLPFAANGADWPPCSPCDIRDWSSTSDVWHYGDRDGRKPSSAGTCAS
ncbi:MAG: hypothetical protein HGA87_05780 [Desulfobulbaceae bacterium]|nr:hypothetical protein [Desulfobulbaceae bacterium]